jgi:hypothetical protein
MLGYAQEGVHHVKMPREIYTPLPQLAIALIATCGWTVEPKSRGS